MAGNELLDTLSLQKFQAQSVGKVFPLFQDLVELRDALLLTPRPRLLGILANAQRLQPVIEGWTEALLALQAQKQAATDTSNIIFILACAPSAHLLARGSHVAESVSAAAEAYGLDVNGPPQGPGTPTRRRQQRPWRAMAVAWRTSWPRRRRRMTRSGPAVPAMMD